MREGSWSRWTHAAEDVSFVRRVLIVIALGALVALLWQLSNVLLLAFGAVLVAVVLHGLADLLARRVRVPERWSLLAAGCLIFVFAAGLLILFGAQMRVQIAYVAERLPLAVNTLSRELGLGDITNDVPRMLGMGPGSGFVARLAGIGAAVLGGLADFLLVIVAGAFIAANPGVYRDGVVMLFPQSQHERIRSSLEASGQALKLWVAGQLIAMTFVGVLSAIGLWWLGVPSAFALGLLAGLADFIPFIGPILGALPAVLMASTIDAYTVLWTVLLFVVIQQLEGNIVFPLVGRRMVSLPPALALFAIVAAGVLFGWLGLIFGFPLAVVAFVLVKKLYVRETLGEQTPVPGEKETPGVTSE